ncbi:MAG: NusG domain II-containing protein [Thioalkalivibrio sp.]
MRAPGTLGDGLVILCAVALVSLSYLQFWTGAPDGPASEVRIVAGGDEFARLPLDQPRWLDIPGPAGITRVEVAVGAARCAESPGTQGICQRAGWLRQPGDVAVSIPNRVLIEVLGEAGQHFDSINY